MNKVCRLVIVVAGMLAPVPVAAQKPNYEESKVPEYQLPDPLVCLDGTRVETAETWNRKRRPEILRLFEHQVYGRQPELGRIRVTETFGDGLKEPVRLERYTMIQRRLGYARNSRSVTLNVLLILPPDADNRPVPVFLGYNFFGNQTVSKNPRIEITENWVRNRESYGIKNHRAGEKSRGVSASRWPIEEIVSRGYGVATIYYGDVDPDFDDKFQNGVHPLAYSGDQKMPKRDEWGSIAAWAWGLSRVLDFLESRNGVDAKKVVVLGHSRLGKTALWAGASDRRFAIVISNNSGCGGAALSRRAVGETVKRINDVFPHWFCGNFKQYNGKENEIPVDQHMLVSLIAPRPVYIASASEDRWADPRGEFLSAKFSEPVYALFDQGGLGLDRMPKTNVSVGDSVGYHVRKGKHDITLFDWQQYMNFADRHFGK